MAACELLAASGTCAIQAVLRAAGNALAACDYHAVYRPGLAAARAALGAPSGGPGPAGRHLAKHAFITAVRQEIARVAARQLAAVLAEFRSDERYAAAIARDANASRPRLAAA